MKSERVIGNRWLVVGAWCGRGMGLLLKSDVGEFYFEVVAKVCLDDMRTIPAYLNLKVKFAGLVAA